MILDAGPKIANFPLTLIFRGISDIIPSIGVYKGSEWCDYGITPLNSRLIIQDAKRKKIDIRLTLILRIYSEYSCSAGGGKTLPK
jgi:hypothetical protein